MKISGQDMKIATGKVYLPRAERAPIELRIQALPLGFEERLLTIFPMPRPPRELVMRRGKPLRDDEGRPQWDVNEHDAGYVGERAKRASLQAVATMHEALKADSLVTWTATAPDRLEDVAAWRTFYEQLSEEIKQAGLTVGDVGLILKAVAKLSNLDDAAAEAAIEGFLSGER